MKTFNTYIEEGVHDPGIFKAFFTAGGPGSGKSYVATQGGMGGRKRGKMRMSPFGLKIVDSDPMFEKLLKQAGLETTAKDIYSKRGQAIRDVAKGLIGKRQAGWVEGRLGLLIDGTGKDYKKIQTLRTDLNSIGYDTYMLFVNTSLDVALQRNEMRTRKLDATDVENMWKAVQENMGKFQLLFGRQNFILIDNNSASEDVFGKLFVQIKILVDDPVTSKAALAWIRSQLPQPT